MKFFFDRNISEHLAKIIAAYDRANTIVHQDRDARFDPRTTDEDLIMAVGQESPKPVWVSADIAQKKKNGVERLALVNSGMTLVFFRGGFNSTPFHQQAVKILTVWPNIVQLTQYAKGPTLFEVSNGMSSNKVEDLGLVKDCLRA